MTVFPGNIVFGQTVVELERRINAVESGAGSIVVTESAGVNSYPLRSGGIDRVVADAGVVRDVSINRVTGYALISVNRGVNDFDLELWDDQSPGELIWSIEGSPGGTGNHFRSTQDRQGNIYAITTTFSPFTFGIRKYNSSQTEQWTTTSWFEGEDIKEFVSPSSVALTNNGSTVLVVDPPRVEQFAASSGAHTGGFDLTDQGNNAITVLPNGKIYIVQSSVPFPLDNRIVRYSSGGTFELEWGSSGDGDGEFGGIIGITSSPNHNVIFVYDHTLAPLPFAGRVQAFDADGTFLWSRAVGLPHESATDIGGTAFGFGAQTEWFYYPTELTIQRVSAGTPDGGFAVPADNFYGDQIIRPNIVAAMQAAIEAVAPSYVNGLTGNPFNWDSSDPDNLYTVAVDFANDDWDKPTKEDLEDVAIRPDEYNEISKCLDVLELSFPV